MSSSELGELSWVLLWREHFLVRFSHAHPWLLQRSKPSDYPGVPPIPWLISQSALSVEIRGWLTEYRLLSWPIFKCSYVYLLQAVWLLKTFVFQWFSWCGDLDWKLGTVLVRSCCSRCGYLNKLEGKGCSVTAEMKMLCLGERELQLSHKNRKLDIKLQGLVWREHAKSIILPTWLATT